MIPFKNDKDSKKKQVRKMFNHIANRYDFLNHFFSIGMDKYWQRRSTKILKKVVKNESKILDLATGTGNWVIDLLKLNPKKIVGADIAEDMLYIAKSKFINHPFADKVSFQIEDAENLSIKDMNFDLVTVAYGVRNFENLSKGISEIYRVLKPNGYIAILELTTPDSFPMKQLYKVYSKVVIPILGGIISKDKSAYKYLPESIEEFSKEVNISEELVKTGFKDSQAKKMTFGVVTLYYGKK